MSFLVLYMKLSRNALCPSIHFYKRCYYCLWVIWVRWFRIWARISLLNLLNLKFLPSKVTDCSIIKISTNIGFVPTFFLLEDFIHGWWRRIDSWLNKNRMIRAALDRRMLYETIAARKIWLQVTHRTREHIEK